MVHPAEAVVLDEAAGAFWDKLIAPMIQKREDTIRGLLCSLALRPAKKEAKDIERSRPRIPGYSRNGKKLGRPPGKGNKPNGGWPKRKREAYYAARKAGYPGLKLPWEFRGPSASGARRDAEGL